MIPKYRAWKKAGKELGRVGQITFELSVLDNFLKFNVVVK